ncbi:MAG: fibronectin type III domain-containing protein, partial [Thermoplasmata archaeon]|nr:fibronectin type III domain-containing protein [Thermoplasmata archaeon]
LDLSWKPSTDNESGVDFYRFFWRQHTFNATTRYADTNDTSATVGDCIEGVPYWFWVRAYDGVGNHADSEMVRTIFDFSPPPVVSLDPIPEYITNTSIEVSWDVARDAGVGDVKYWLAWRSLEDERHVYSGMYEGGDSGYISWTSYTVEDLKDGVTYAFWVHSRDFFFHQSEESEHLYLTVDLSPPVVEIETPIQDEVHSGTITINGTFNESTPVFFTVIHYSSAASGYIYVRDPETILVEGLFSISWDTTQVPDGATAIRVVVRDALDREAFDEVGITISNGKPLVSREDIWFSDTDPFFGHVITVMVKVRNEGDRAVEDLRLEVYDGGNLIGVEPSVTVGPHSESVYWFPMRVGERHNITARAFSDLYDTGEMETSVWLEGKNVRNGIPDSEPIPWLVLFAIALAVIAIALNLVDRRREGVPGTADGDLRIESKDGED